MPITIDDDMVEVKIFGFNRVRNQLRTAAAFHPEHTDPIIEKHVKAQTKALRKKAYPPRWPGQKYVRTGLLGRRFRAQRQPGKARWAVINRVPYAIHVVKKGAQSGPIGDYPGHKGRWWTLEDTMAATMPELTKALSVELEDLMSQQKDTDANLS